MQIKSLFVALLVSFSASTVQAQDTVLVEHTVLGGKVAILAPATFTTMTPEEVRAKYPPQRPPTEVIANARRSISIAFGHTQNALRPAQVRQAHEALEGQIRATYPSVRINRSEVVRRGNQDVAVVDFWSPTLDGEVRNIMVIVSVEGRALIASFNVTRELEGEWGSIGERIMESIRLADAPPPPTDLGKPDFVGRGQVPR